MQKAGFKAFICSFSVSLLSIMAANRAFLQHNPSHAPLIISHKNIALFVKNTSPAKYPVKKIELNTLKDITSKSTSVPLREPEVILAELPESIDIPLTTHKTVNNKTKNSESQELVLSDIVYSPEKSSEQLITLSAEPIYEPELAQEFIPPLLEDNALSLENSNNLPNKIIVAAEDTKPNQDEDALNQARTSKLGLIPLETGLVNNSDRNIKIGNPDELNHVALNSQTIPIQSMEKAKEQTPETSDGKSKKWKPMKDNPWLIAESRAGGKNLFAVKTANKDIQKTLNPLEQREGVQVASETVKNLIIPIPKDVMSDENLTPQLAYPQSSEDASKEKKISEEIKLQENAVKKLSEITGLLSPIPDDDVDLDALAIDSSKNTENKEKPQKKEAKQATEKTKENTGIMNKINSIFSNSAKSISDAKERAIAQAKIKRSLDKRKTSSRPVSIMPTEIKLSFQPNKAEISGQTLRWVQAFANKAAQDPSATLEIRIDSSSQSYLQQKRLNLLHNILASKGVEYEKIRTVFTVRDPNSFVLRSIGNNNTEKGTEKIDMSHHNHIQW